MEHHPLTTTGALRLGMGCWAVGGPFWSGDKPLGWGAVDDAESTAAIRRALVLGVTICDTADVYGAGHGELVLGRALAGLRNEVLMATKWGNVFDETARQIVRQNTTPGYVRLALEASLCRLGTDYLALHQLHVEVNVLRDAPEMLALTGHNGWASICRGPLLSPKYTSGSRLSREDVRGDEPEWVAYFHDGRPDRQWVERRDAVRAVLTPGRRTLVQGAPRGYGRAIRSAFPYPDSVPRRWWRRTRRPWSTAHSAPLNCGTSTGSWAVPCPLPRFAVVTLDRLPCNTYLRNRMEKSLVAIDQALTDRPTPDAAMARLIAAELARQSTTINLIAAANYLSPAVGAAMHPALEAIHCEGYPGRRYHEGQEAADGLERLAIERARRLFGAEHANVQPYRGTMANLAAAIAVLDPGDTLLGLQTASGGHYSTGGSLHLIGRMFRVVPYEVAADTGELDYEAISAVARAERPRAIFCGDTSYPRLWNYAALRAIADESGAVLIADISQSAGLIAGGAIPSPAPHADIMTAATYKTLRGPRAGLILAKDRFAKAVDRAVYPICQGGTNVRVLAGIATALGEALTEGFRAYTRRVIENSRCLADELAFLGLDLVTGGTENHACLVDLRSLSITGDAAARRLASAGILSNGNQIPDDPNPPRMPSGLRFGTAAVTTLGMTPTEMTEVAGLIARVLREDGRSVDDIRRRVLEIRCEFGQPTDEWSGVDAEDLL